MSEADKVFAGSIPENYDRYLVPLIFESFAQDMAQRVAALSPRTVLVSVRRVLESYESVVIQRWWPDSRRVTNVDEHEPRTLRPQQAAISERFDRRRMGAGRTFDLTWQARRRQANSDHT